MAKHAEFLKLLVARERGRPVEWLDGIERHFGHRAIARSNERFMSDASRARGAASLWHWREEAPVARLPRGKTLAIENRVAIISEPPKAAHTPLMVPAAAP
jgi:glucoamylase